MSAGRLCCAVMLAALAMAACENPQAIPTGHDHAAVALSRVGAGHVDGLAKQVRQVTARFNATQQATMLGYVQDSPCVAVPGMGGMGFHWVNHSLVDPVFEPLKPEVVLYAPRPNGQLELVAVEYIVIDVGQPAPTFDGQAFDVGGSPVPVAHWTLHVWVHRENPNGLFTPFNPTVVCP